MRVTETVYVATRKAWRGWLSRNHARKTEIWLIYYKKQSGRPRVAYADAVEEALCFGWIDSIVKTLDPERFAQRFTPRKAASNWSALNLQRVRRLVSNGQMTPAGAALIPSAKKAREFQEQHVARVSAPTTPPRDLAAALRANAGAAAQWKVLAPGYRRLYVRMVIESKQPETRKRRIVKCIALLASGRRHPLGDDRGRSK
jgi:uncharacterized protein YdeI (YjbR/CyaY-like superfamily)